MLCLHLRRTHNTVSTLVHFALVVVVAVAPINNCTPNFLSRGGKGGVVFHFPIFFFFLWAAANDAGRVRRVHRRDWCSSRKGFFFFRILTYGKGKKSNPALDFFLLFSFGWGFMSGCNPSIRWEEG